jgi:hypothetical protein
MTTETPKRGRPGHPVHIRGVTYPSLRAAAKALGVTVQAVWDSMRRGTLETCGLGYPNGTNTKPIVINGTAYPSLQAVADAFGVTAQDFRVFIKVARKLGIDLVFPVIQRPE